MYDIKLLARLLAKARIEAGKSQEYMAEALGKNRRTIANWESGKSAPTVIEALEWYDALNLSPLSSLVGFVYPDRTEHIKYGNEDVIEKELVRAVKALPIDEKRILLYVLEGDHGSARKVTLNMWLAYYMSQIRSRIPICRLIYDNYVMDDMQGITQNTNGLAPDAEVIRDGLKKAYKSISNGTKQYTYR